MKSHGIEKLVPRPSQGMGALVQDSAALDHPLSAESEIYKQLLRLMPPGLAQLENGEPVHVSTDASVRSTQESASPSVEPLGTQSAPAQSPAATAIAFDFAALIAAISEAPTRSFAIKALVDRIAIGWPQLSVRAGIGNSRLKSFYDSRLGWLGAESELQRDLANRWKMLTGSAESPAPQADAEPMPLMDQTNGDELGPDEPAAPPDSVSHAWVVRLSDQEMVLVLCPKERTQASSQAIVLRISGSGLSDSHLATFAPWAPTFASVLWSRPTYALPRWLHSRSVRRIILIVVVIALAVGLFFPKRYGINATVRVEPTAPRIVSAPFEALIEEVLVHPGDEVKEGQTLVRLDGRPLRLERQSLDAEISQALKQKDIAVASGRVAESQQAQLRYQQLLRRRDLIDRRLEQLSIVSPIDGVVVSGDLRRAVGASLELGRVLMEVAPLDRVMVEIAIPEYEVSMVRPESDARLRIDASGAPTITCGLIEMHPAGELRDDEVVFISLLELDNSTRVFRPGMTGKATVYGEYRPLIWPYARKMIDQVTWLMGM